MLVAETYVGHRGDPSVASLLADADPHSVVLSDTERRRSRVRTKTKSDRDVGVVVGRVLADGDVLETQGGEFVVVDLASVEALVVDFAEADDVAATTAVELGHAAGNRHWDLAVRGREALFPVTESRDRMEATLSDELPDGTTVRYEAVPPCTFDDAGAADHSHANGAADHSHANGAAHAPGHDGGDHIHSDDESGEHAHSHDDGTEAHSQGHARGEDGGDGE